MLNQKHIGYLLIITAVVSFILLSVIKINFDNQGAFLCEAVANDPTTTMMECPAHKSPISWTLTVLFGFSFVILAAGIYLLFIPVKTATKQIIKPSKLDEQERKIYDLLGANERSMYQSDLIKETEFSKVKMTRILDKLETKGVIDRKRRGMTNLIILK